jgi:hypothetical protein
LNDTQHFIRLSKQKEESLLKAVSILNKWLDELMFRGISSLQHDAGKILEISTRMVDYGLPGIARKLRLLPDKIKESVDWTSFVFMQLGEFYTFVKLFEKLNVLDELEKEDLLSYAGIVYKKSDFVEDGLLQDEWLYLGNQQEKEEKLIVKRNWFYGIHSRQTILFLEFQFNRFAKFKPLSCGTIYRSGVRFFPSKVYQRIKDISTDQIVKADLDSIQKVNINGLLDGYCNAVILNPFFRHQCYLLHEVKMTRHSGKWFFTNNENQMLEVTNDEKDIPKILVYSSNEKTVYVCEYFNNTAFVISILVGNMMIEM